MAGWLYSWPAKIQILSLVNNNYPYYDVETKYGESSILRQLPFFKKNSNAFLSNRKLSFNKLFLKNGTKKLVYEIELPNQVLLLLAHLSLRKNQRKRRIEELKTLHSGKKSKILCGDLNTLQGDDEVKELENSLNVRSAHENPTFPSVKPNVQLDHFLFVLLLQSCLIFH